MELSGKLQTMAPLSLGKGHPAPTVQQALCNSYSKKTGFCLYTLMILPKDITDINGQRTRYIYSYTKSNFYFQIMP